MMMLDLASLTDDEITKRVTESCSQFGLVKRVRVFRATGIGANQFALVDMSSPEEVAKVVSKLGDATLGNAAVIRFGSQSPDHPPEGMFDFAKTFEKLLFGADDSVQNNFLHHFADDVKQFQSNITKAAYVWLGFHRKKGSRRDIDAASLYLFNSINCLATSMRLFLRGYIVPSGNLCRNVLESIAVASLISEPKTKCFEKLERGEEFANKSLNWMRKHADLLGYTTEGVAVLIKFYEFFHHYSHPSMASLGSIVMDEDGPLVFGGIFAGDRLEEYKKEMEIRIDLANLIANTVGVIHILQCAEKRDCI